MSLTFLRAWYQSSLTFFGGVVSDRLTWMKAVPGCVKLVTRSRCGSVLQLLLDLVDDLRLQLRRRRARPADLDVHDLDRERRIFGPAELVIREQAGGADQQDHEQDQRPVRDGPFRQVEVLHGGAPGGCCLLIYCAASTARTFNPASSFCTPRVTILSPLLTPALTSAESAGEGRDRDRAQRSARRPRPPHRRQARCRD